MPSDIEHETVLSHSEEKSAQRSPPGKRARLSPGGANPHIVELGSIKKAKHSPLAAIDGHLQAPALPPKARAAELRTRLDALKRCPSAQSSNAPKVDMPLEEDPKWRIHRIPPALEKVNESLVGKALACEMQMRGPLKLRLAESETRFGCQQLVESLDAYEWNESPANAKTLSTQAIELGRRLGDEAMRRLISERRDHPGIPSHDELLQTHCANPHVATLIGLALVIKSIEDVTPTKPNAHAALVEAIRTHMPHWPDADCTKAPNIHLQALKDKLNKTPLVQDCIDRLPVQLAGRLRPDEHPRHDRKELEESRHRVKLLVKKCEGRVMRFIAEELEWPLRKVSPAEREERRKQIAAESDYLVAALVLRSVPAKDAADVAIGSMLLDELAAQLPAVPDPRRPPDAKAVAAAPAMLERLTRGKFNQDYLDAMEPALEALHTRGVGAPDVRRAHVKFTEQLTFAEIFPTEDEFAETVESLLNLVGALHAQHLVPSYLASLPDDEAEAAIQIESQGSTFKAALAASILSMQAPTPNAGRLALALMARLLPGLVASGLPDDLQQPLRQVHAFMGAPSPGPALDFLAMHGKAPHKASGTVHRAPAHTRAKDSGSDTESLGTDSDTESLDRE